MLEATQTAAEKFEGDRLRKTSYTTDTPPGATGASHERVEEGWPVTINDRATEGLAQTVGSVGLQSLASGVPSRSASMEFPTRNPLPSLVTHTSLLLNGL